jgi:hypothetical protein
MLVVMVCYLGTISALRPGDSAGTGAKRRRSRYATR